MVIFIKTKFTLKQIFISITVLRIHINVVCDIANDNGYDDQMYDSVRLFTKSLKTNFQPAVFDNIDIGK